MREEVDERRVAVERKEKEVSEKELELKGKEVNERFLAVESKEKELDVGVHELELKAKEVDERFQRVRIKEEEISECIQEVDLMKEEADEHRAAVERKEKEVNDRSRGLELQEKLIMEGQKGLDFKEKEADERLQVVESKEKELSVSVHNLEYKAKEVDERFRLVESKDKELGVGVHQLELKAKEVDERFRVVKLKEEELSKRSKVVNLMAEDVERKEGEVNGRFQELELQENQIMESRKGLELIKKEVDERVRAAELKENDMSESLQALDLKDKQTFEREKLVKLREKQVNDGLDALEVKVKQMEDCSKGIELRLQKAVELREKQLNEGLEALKVKAKDLEQCCKVMDAKEMELISRRRAFELREQSIDELCQGLEFNEKQINERWQRLELKEKSFDEGCQRLELKEKKLDASLEALELKENRFDEECREIELKKNEIYDQCNVLGAKEKHLISRERALELREQSVDECRQNLELKEKEFDEHCQGLELKAKELIEGFKALESKERKIDKEYRKMKLKKNKIDDSFEVLEVKEKQIRSRRVLDLREQQINESCMAKESEDKLINEASSIPSSDYIQSLCRNMNAKGLRSYLLQHVKEYDKLNEKMLDSLRLALDPAKLVLNVIRSLYELESEEAPIRRFAAGCIFLLVQLMRLRAYISSRVKDEAREFTDIWRLLLKESNTPSVNLGYLQYLASFQLAEIHDADELLSLFTTVSYETEAYQPEQIPLLCDALGLRSKITDLIQSLVLRDEKLQAIRYICALQMENDFPLVPLLRTHLENVQNRIEKILKIGNCTAQDDAKIVEVTALKEVLECISSCKLESSYSPVSLELRFKQLEKEREENKDTARSSSIRRCSNSEKEGVEDMLKASNHSGLPSDTQTGCISNLKLESSYSTVSLESRFKQLEKEGEESKATTYFSSVTTCSNSKKESVEDMPKASNPSILPSGTQISTFKLESSYLSSSLKLRSKHLEKKGEENKAAAHLSSTKRCSNSAKESVEDMPKPKASNPSVLPSHTQTECISNFKLDSSNSPVSLESLFKQLEKEGEENNVTAYLSGIKSCSNTEKERIEDMPEASNSSVLPTAPQTDKKRPANSEDLPKEEKHPRLHTHHGLISCNSRRPPVHVGHPSRPPVHFRSDGLTPNDPSRLPVHTRPYPNRPPVHVGPYQCRLPGTSASNSYNPIRPPVHVGPYPCRQPGTDRSIRYNPGKPPVHVGPYPCRPPGIDGSIPYNPGRPPVHVGPYPCRPPGIDGSIPYNPGRPPVHVGPYGYPDWHHQSLPPVSWTGNHQYHAMYGNPYDTRPGVYAWNQTVGR